MGIWPMTERAREASRHCGTRRRSTCGRWRAITRGCAVVSGPRSAPWARAGAGRWGCSGPAGAKPRATSPPPRAAATARVTRDVADQLGASVSAGRETLVLRGPLDRDSLRLAVVTLPTAHQRLGWLAARLGELPGSGIVYTLTVAAAQETAAFLREQGPPVAAYTGRGEPQERARAEDHPRPNRVKAPIATRALGLGVGKPDPGF